MTKRRAVPTLAAPMVGTLLTLVVLPALALSPRGDGAVDFGRDVQPIFEARCTKCHAGDQPKSGFRLDARRIALRGGNSGDPAIVPGHPEQSRLVKLLRNAAAPGAAADALRMPPRGDPLHEEEIRTIERWIADGAPWPDALSGDALVRDHWSFVAPRRPDLPEVARAWWPRNPIDFFTLAKMENAHVEPSREAPRETLIRRASLDLIGLPPTPAEVAAFVNDPAPDAYERLVRRLLASPRYGERVARVWLDLARYADSYGYGQDPLRPFLWRWRDWVIDAFNANQRYDQFTIDQLAGDLLPQPTDDQLLATAFHRNTMTNTEGGTIDEEFRVAAVKDRVDSTMQIWMGLTFGCAKCHSHKFDPIPQKDYYRLFSVWNQTEDADRADEEPRLATPTHAQHERKRELERKLAEIAARRDARAEGLGPDQERWEAQLAAAEQKWIVLTPAVAKSKEGAELSIAADGSVRAAGPAPATDVTTVEVSVDVKQLAAARAFRLEALPDPELPNGGPGRSEGNGNFVLNEFSLSVLPQDVAPPARGRWLRIELPGPDRILSLAEVEVFSKGVDLARKGTATQSSVDFDGPPELALDGNNDGAYLAAKSTTHTRQSADPWWEVDLGEGASAQPIDQVVLWNRTDGNLGFRLANARVRLFREDVRPDGTRAREVVWQTILGNSPERATTLDPGALSAVAFARATADVEQDRFFVNLAIDGSDAPASGWAIAPRRGTRHVAQFEADGPLVAAPATAGAAARIAGDRVTLRFELRQTWGAQHTLGRFRLSFWRGPNPPEVLPEAVALALTRPEKQRNAAERARVAAHYRELAPELAPFRAEAKPVEEALASLDREVVRTPVMRELPPEKRRTTHVLQKSNWLAPGEVVEPDTPRAFPPLPAGAPKNRLSVARWLVSPENPLSARVTVNRFWAQLFGRGIVETEEDFGTQGAPPTDPKLLDWLATRFVESGWDVKELLFTIATSATYRQSSNADAERLAADPRDLLLARYPRRRLEAEMVRDQALAIAGLLAPELHGPSVFPPQPDGLWQVAFNAERTYPTSTGPDRWRRGLYCFWRRTVPPPSMQTFDAPSREFCTVRRQSTNTPLQAFVTLNDPVFVEAAQAFARRIVTEGGATTEARVAFALQLALVRAPRDEEVAVLVKLFQGELARDRADPAAARALCEQPLGPLPKEMDPAELAAWTTVANVVLNLDAVLVKG